ncbi:MAG: glycosyltransferase family 4 protein [Steroidobacteraceae bacterium]
MTQILTIGMGWFGEEAGGLNRMYAGLLGSLAGNGATVRGLVAGSLEASGSAPAGLSFFGRRDASAIRRLLACRRAVCAALAADQIDVVAAHFSLYALPMLDLLQTRRFVFHFHGPWAGESQAEGERGINVAVKRTIESRVYRRADRFIALSSAFARILERQYRIAAERIFIVPGGVDADRYSMSGSRQEARERLRLPTDRPLIVSVRRLIHRVGLEGLIDAMAEVRRSVPEALLLIAGRGAMAGELAKRIEAHTLEDHVRLLGFVAEQDLPWLYRACDFSIVPSVALEGFGLPTIESLSAGTPVLVTPVGGLPETVAELDPGLVLRDASKSSLADGMSWALRDLGKLPSPESCTRYVREHFDWPVIARKVLAVYEQ